MMPYIVCNRPRGMMIKPPTEMPQRITRKPEVLGGKPIIRGTRIAVDLVMDWIETGVFREEILQDYPNLSAAGLDAAVEFTGIDAPAAGE